MYNRCEFIKLKTELHLKIKKLFLPGSKPLRIATINKSATTRKIRSNYYEKRINLSLHTIVGNWQVLFITLQFLLLNSKSLRIATSYEIWCCCHFFSYALFVVNSTLLQL